MRHPPTVSSEQKAEKKEMMCFLVRYSFGRDYPLKELGIRYPLIVYAAAHSIGHPIFGIVI
jgi:hypothetical protein